MDVCIQRAPRWIVGLLAMLCLLPGGATFAAARGEVSTQVEASMLVTGMIDVDEQGKVTGYTLDQEGKLPAGVVEVLGKSVPGWAFAPVVVDGKPVKARTDMGIRVVVHKQEDGNFAIELRGMSFGMRSGDPSEQVGVSRLTPPGYPGSAARMFMTATVYLLVKVGRNGKVEDVIDEQVNLSHIGTEKAMANGREAFAAAAIEQARKWRFKPPAQGPEVDAPFWTVRVPVVFSVESLPPGYGQWQGYIPGTRRKAPWEQEDEGLAFSPDALPSSGIFQPDSRWRLLSMGP
ncbi:TonB family protein [Lysobacter fragariae]